MALPWTLAVLSLLPLLGAHSPACTNITVPITNATLDQISGKWFYIASAYRHPEYKTMAAKISAAFFYFDANHTEDTILLRDYLTVEDPHSGDKCLYNSSYVTVYRENGTLVRYEGDTEHHRFLLLPKDPRILMVAAYPDDTQNMGLFFYADKQEVTQEQLEQFYETITCMGMNKTEIVYAEGKKDLCAPLEKQHDEEKKKEEERSKEDNIGL